MTQHSNGANMLAPNYTGHTAQLMNTGTYSNIARNAIDTFHNINKHPLDLRNTANDIWQKEISNTDNQFRLNSFLNANNEWAKTDENGYNLLEREFINQGDKNNWDFQKKGVEHGLWLSNLGRNTAIDEATNMNVLNKATGANSNDITSNYISQISEIQKMRQAGQIDDTTAANLEEQAKQTFISSTTGSPIQQQTVTSNQNQIATQPNTSNGFNVVTQGVNTYYGDKLGDHNATYSSNKIKGYVDSNATAIANGATFRDIFAKNNIAINKGEGATSVNKFKPETAAGVMLANELLGGNIIITGGAEGSKIHAQGGYSHGNGYKFDFQLKTGQRLPLDKEKELAKQFAENNMRLVWEGPSGNHNRNGHYDVVVLTKKTDPKIIAEAKRNLNYDTNVDKSEKNFLEDYDKILNPALYKAINAKNDFILGNTNKPNFVNNVINTTNQIPSRTSKPLAEYTERQADVFSNLSPEEQQAILSLPIDQRADALDAKFEEIQYLAEQQAVNNPNNNSYIEQSYSQVVPDKQGKRIFRLNKGLGVNANARGSNWVRDFVNGDKTLWDTLINNPGNVFIDQANAYANSSPTTSNIITNAAVSTPSGNIMSIDEYNAMMTENAKKEVTQGVVPVNNSTNSNNSTNNITGSFNIDNIKDNKSYQTEMKKLELEKAEKITERTQADKEKIDKFDSNRSKSIVSEREYMLGEMFPDYPVFATPFNSKQDYIDNINLNKKEFVDELDKNMKVQKERAEQKLKIENFLNKDISTIFDTRNSNNYTKHNDIISSGIEEFSTQAKNNKIEDFFMNKIEYNYPAKGLANTALTLATIDMFNNNKSDLTNFDMPNLPSDTFKMLNDVSEIITKNPHILDNPKKFIPIVQDLLFNDYQSMGADLHEKLINLVYLSSLYYSKFNQKGTKELFANNIKHDNINIPELSSGDIKEIYTNYSKYLNR